MSRPASGFSQALAALQEAGFEFVIVGVGPDDLPAREGERCASVSGVSLHANVAVPARDRRRLERLCRYVARPPVATERLSRMEDGRLLYRLKHRWRDGTTHVVFEPQELVEKLAALVPGGCPGPSSCGGSSRSTCSSAHAAAAACGCSPRSSRPT